MNVKSIFKTLIGTIVVMVVIALVVEMINVSTTSFQLTQMAKIACRQSAVLFSQETYKERTEQAVNGGTVNLDPVTTIDGGNYIEGNFYGIGLTPEQIYNNIYTSTKFRTWLNTPAAQKGHWKSVELIDRALNDPSSLNVTFPNDITNPNYEALAEDYADAMLAKSYKSVMMTPLNMGVPYIDKDILEKMFRWNLAQIASDCNPEAIRKENDNSNNYCIFYKGFRVYADQAIITNIEYRVYDIEDMADKQEFERITHINPDELGYDDNLINYLGGFKDDDERKRICVLGLEYSIPIAYEGITPIKDICSFIWNFEVEGMDGNQGNDSLGTTWNDSKADLNSGGFGQTYTPGVLPVPGKLIYYVVR